MLSIIIPAHNESTRISRTLQDYLSHFSKRTGLVFEIIVVANGCVDDTEEIVNSFCKHNNQVRLHSIQQKGKGRAIKTGFINAKGDIISYTDADGATTGAEFENLVTQLGSFDGVIASRWLGNSTVLPRQPIVRILASRAFNLLVRLILGLGFRDTQCGAKVFTRSAISTVIDDLTIDGFAFDIELLYQLKLKNRQILEIPINWHDHRDSTLKLVRSALGMLRDIVRVRIHNCSY